MKISGGELKKLVEEGLEEHQKFLTIALNSVLQEFADSLKKDKEYDLLSCFAEMILRAGEEAGPIIADLMKTGHPEMDILEKHTFSAIGYFFSDYLRKEASLAHFRSYKKD